MDIGRKTFKHVTNGNIIVTLGEAVSENTNKPVVLYISINREDNGNKVMPTDSFNMNYKPYKVK